MQIYKNCNYAPILYDIYHLKVQRVQEAITYYPQQWSSTVGQRANIQILLAMPSQLYQYASSIYLICIQFLPLLTLRIV